MAARFVKLENRLFSYHLNGNEMKLYLCLKHYSFADGCATVKMETICRFCRFSVATAYKALATLERNHLVVKSNRYANGQYIANGYQVVQLGGGWSKLPLAAFELGRSNFLVYAYLCRCQRFGNKAWASYTAIAQAIKVSRTTAIEAIKELRRVGYLLKAAIRPGKHNLYFLIGRIRKSIKSKLEANCRKPQAVKFVVTVKWSRKLAAFLIAGITRIKRIPICLREVVQKLKSKPYT